VTTYRIAPDVAWHATEGRVAVLDLADIAAVPFVLEGSASAIWNAVAESGSAGADGVLTAVAGRFGLDPIDVEDDVRAFLDELVGRALIVTDADLSASQALSEQPEPPR